MPEILLSFETVTDPAFDGFGFYVECGQPFDAQDYCDAYGLQRCDLEPQSVHSAQDAAGRLNPGEWMRVTHD